MSDNKSQVTALWALVGLGLLVIAIPVGDWIGHFFKSDTEIIATRSESPAPTTMVLHVRRNVPVKPTEPEATPTPEKPHKSAKGGRSGTLTNDEIEIALQNKESQFSRCWTQRLREAPGLKGNLSLQFEINPRGRVQSVQIVESNIDDENLKTCVVSVLERVTFREFSGGPVTLTFPLQFE